MDLPSSEPSAGDPLRADWGRAIQRAVRANRITGVTGGTFTRTPSGTVLNLDRPRAGGGSGEAPDVDHPFKGIATGLSVSVLIGYVNELTTRIGTTQYPYLSQVPLVANGGGGKTYYAYALLQNSDYPPEIRTGDHVPYNTETIHYFPLFAYFEKKNAQNQLTGALEIVQYAWDNIRFRWPLPFAVDLYTEGTRRYLDIAKGTLHISVADLTRAEGFADDTPVRPGEWRFLLSATNWSIGAIRQTLSLWVAVEYPATGALLSASLTRRLNLTPTTDLPSSVPWIVLGKKSTVADAGGAGSIAAPGTGKSGEADAGQQFNEPPTRPPNEEDADAELNRRKPQTAARGEFVTGTDSAPQNETLATKVIGTWIERPRGVTWYDAQDNVIGTDSAIIVWQYSTAWDSGWSGNWWRPNEDGGVVKLDEWSVPGLGFVLEHHIISYYEVREEFVSYSGTLINGKVDGAPPTGNFGRSLVTNGNANGYHRVRLKRTTKKKLFVIAGGVPSESTNSVTTPSGTTYSPETIVDYDIVVALFTGRAGGFVDRTLTPGDIDPLKDGMGRASESPGGSRKDTAAAGPAPNTPDHQAGRNAGGVALTSRGSGLWVYEIARLYPTGRVEQLITGDIHCFPAAQVQLRTDPPPP